MIYKKSWNPSCTRCRTGLSSRADDTRRGNNVYRHNVGDELEDVGTCQCFIGKRAGRARSESFPVDGGVDKSAERTWTFGRRNHFHAHPPEPGTLDFRREYFPLGRSSRRPRSRSHGLKKNTDVGFVRGARFECLIFPAARTWRVVAPRKPWKHVETR